MRKNADVNLNTEQFYDFLKFNIVDAYKQLTREFKCINPDIGEDIFCSFMDNIDLGNFSSNEFDIAIDKATKFLRDAIKDDIVDKYISYINSIVRFYLANSYNIYI